MHFKIYWVAIIWCIWVWRGSPHLSFIIIFDLREYSQTFIAMHTPRLKRFLLNLDICNRNHANIMFKGKLHLLLALGKDSIHLRNIYTNIKYVYHIYQYMWSFHILTFQEQIKYNNGFCFSDFLNIQTCLEKRIHRP